VKIHPSPLLLSLSALLLSACPAAPTTDVVTPVCPTTASSETIAIYEGLRSSCQGCHQSGERGYFASVSAFQSLVVADPRFVTPGDPTSSGFVALLEGTASGSFAQMPPAGPTYAALVDGGAAGPSMADVRAWIEGLSAQARDPRPDVNAPRITRMSAVQIRRALYQQLGLDGADFFIPAYEFGIEMAESRGDDRYPLLSGDEVPAPRQRVTFERHQGLGGGAVVEQVTPDASASVNFAHTIVQVSQAWCRLALSKQNNTALFATATEQADESADNVAATVHRWARHFHAVDLDETETQTFVTLFNTLRADPAGDLNSAWSGVCSAFIRHPRWVFY
jgi:hypothetical protein